jgi:hypothetical protein
VSTTASAIRFGVMQSHLVEGYSSRGRGDPVRVHPDAPSGCRATLAPGVRAANTVVPRAARVNDLLGGQVRRTEGRLIVRPLPQGDRSRIGMVRTASHNVGVEGDTHDSDAGALHAIRRARLQQRSTAVGPHFGDASTLPVLISSPQRLGDILARRSGRKGPVLQKSTATIPTPAEHQTHQVRRACAQRRQMATWPRLCKHEVLWLDGLSGGEEQKVAIDLP